MRFFWIGRLAYGEALQLQKALLERRVAGEIADTVLLLEHPAVVTLGRAAKDDHLLVSRSLLAERGVEVHEVGRGGDVTYHGPGQLVAYPIIDLKPDRQDVRKYVWSLEEAMIRTCAQHGLTAGRISGLNGAWIGDRKVGAVGVRISRWVTMHGLALNVSTSLADFEWIVPCGIQEKAVTSMSAELGRELGIEETARQLAENFAALYDTEVDWHAGAPD